MSTPNLVVFVGNWWHKRGVLMHNEHKELRSEVGNQVDQAKAGNTISRVKSNIKGSNTSVSGVADFESWKYGHTFLEKS